MSYADDKAASESQRQVDHKAATTDAQHRAADIQHYQRLLASGSSQYAIWSQVITVKMHDKTGKLSLSGVKDYENQGGLLIETLSWLGVFGFVAAIIADAIG